MNHVFEVQLIDSVNNANRKPAGNDLSIVVLNMTVLMIGFVSMSLGYAVSTIRVESVLQVFKSFVM